MYIIFIHYGLHLFLPLGVALFLYKKIWLKAWSLMMLAMLIDIDHLWAQPIYDPSRCSVGFHTFHTWPFILLYIVLTFWPKTRLIGWGLVLHLLTDTVDCILQGHYFNN